MAQRFRPQPPPRPTTFVSIQREIQVRGPAGPLTNLKRHRTRAELTRQVKTLARDPVIAPWIVGVPFPQKLAEIQTAPLLKYWDLRTELFWEATVLSLFLSELNHFIPLRRQFSEELLAANYVDAERTLKDIEGRFGFSIWTVENRIALIATASGLEKQKEFSSSIVNNNDVRSTVRVLTRYLSIRAEPTVSPFRFTRLLNGFLRNQPTMGSSLRQYYRFKLDFLGGHEFLDVLPQVLLFDSNAAIVDRYNTFIRVCQLVVASTRNKGVLRGVTDSVHVLRAGINDPALFNLCAILGITPPDIDPVIPRAIHSLVESYTIGEYTKCTEDSEKLLQEHPALIEVSEIYAKASIRRSEKHTPNLPRASRVLVDHLRSILVLDETAPSSVAHLLKLATVNGSHPWAAQIVSFLMQEYRHDRGAAGERLIIFGELNSYPGNPRLYVFIRKAAFPTIYPAHVENRKLSPTSHRLMDILSNSRLVHPDTLKELGLPDARFRKYLARLLHERGDFEDALRIYTDLLAEPGSVSYYENLLPGVRCFLSAGLLEDALRLTIAAYLANRNVAARLPIAELIERIETEDASALRSMIELPILYDLYYYEYSGARELERADACEDFLRTHGMRRPSVMRSMGALFDKNALNHFLRYVCVLEVLDCSVEFESTEDVQQERISILQLLLEMDPESADSYSNEIRALTTSLTVARGIREVEQSKIYVDVAGVKRTVEGVLKDNYARYLDLLRHTPETFDTQAIILAIGRVENLTESVDIYLPADEKFDLLRSMVVDIRDKFVSSNEYGLDSSLSMGFRHGTLSGQLRPQLEAAHLVTLKDSRTNIYRSNEHWARILEAQSGSRESVLQRLNRFSAEVDELIDEVNTAVIKVSTETRRSTGLFDFSISPWFVKRLQVKIKSQTEFDEFFVYAVHELWARTDECLEAMRKYIEQEFKPRFERIFDGLSGDLSFHDSTALRPIFDTIIQAKIDTQYNLDRVQSWFARTTADETADYQVRLPISIGLETVHNVYLEQPIEPVYELDESLRFKGKTLSGLTNIMFLLFDNIRKYAALNGGVRQFVCHVRREDDLVIFSVVNSVPEDVNGQAEDNKLTEMRDTILAASLSGRLKDDKVKGEGRSGFYKVAKVLLFELGGVADLEFGFNPPGMFTVEFAVSTRALLA